MVCVLRLPAPAAGDSAAFSRERKEMRENFDKETKAMKRQIELLQVCVSLAAPPWPHLMSGCVGAGEGRRLQKKNLLVNNSDNNIGMCWCR